MRIKNYKPDYHPVCKVAVDVKKQNEEMEAWVKENKDKVTVVKSGKSTSTRPSGWH